tara:strand:- start:285 stop:425 length:141 start_codon:yes stop_codon:yes gene_type:complete
MKGILVFIGIVIAVSLVKYIISEEHKSENHKKFMKNLEDFDKRNKK